MKKSSYSLVLFAFRGFALLGCKEMVISQSTVEVVDVEAIQHLFFLTSFQKDAQTQNPLFAVDVAVVVGVESEGSFAILNQFCRQGNNIM